MGVQLRLDLWNPRFRVDACRRAVLEILRENGGYVVTRGFEEFCDYVEVSAGINVDPEDVRQALLELRREGIINYFTRFIRGVFLFAVKFTEKYASRNNIAINSPRENEWIWIAEGRMRWPLHPVKVRA